MIEPICQPCPEPGEWAPTPLVEICPCPDPTPPPPSYLATVRREVVETDCFSDMLESMTGKYLCGDVDWGCK